MEGTALLAVADNGEMIVAHRPEDGERTLARVPLTGGPLRDVLTDFGQRRLDPRRLRSSPSPGSRARRGWSTRWAPPSPRARGASATRASRPTASAWRSSSTRSWETIGAWSRSSTGRDSSTVLSDGWASIQGLAWSPTAARSGSPPPVRARCAGFTRWTSTGDLRTITTAPGRLIIQDIAPDGRVLLVHELKRAEIYGRGPDAEEEISLSWRDYSFAADLSADGRQVLLSESGEAGRTGLRRLPPRTPTARRRSAWARDAPSRCPPDGAWALTMPLDPPERLVLLPTGAGEERTLPLAPLVNGAVRELVPGRREACSSWRASPDGRLRAVREVARPADASHGPSPPRASSAIPRRR